MRTGWYLRFCRTVAIFDGLGLGGELATTFLIAAADEAFAEGGRLLAFEFADIPI